MARSTWRKPTRCGATTRSSRASLASQARARLRRIPDRRRHGWKFIRFGPDGWLYVPVGAPCNVCDREAPYATITRLKPDGSAMEVFARGVRNSVGFDWHPETKELWFTDNGRDMMGDDVPPDELNHAPRAGMHFGFSLLPRRRHPDPEFGAKRRTCSEFTPPAQKFGAHVASLGMRFYTGSMFPAEYRNRIFIAEHGSWNRSKKSGYRVMQAKGRGRQGRRLRRIRRGLPRRGVRQRVGPPGRRAGDARRRAARFRRPGERDLSHRLPKPSTTRPLVTREMPCGDRFVPFSTDRPDGRTDTALINRGNGKQMNNARIDRMLRELDCDPSHQFFSALFGIIGLGKTAAKPAAESAPIQLSLLGNAPAR